MMIVRRSSMVAITMMMLLSVVNAQNNFSVVLYDTLKYVRGLSVTPTFDGNYFLCGQYHESGLICKVDTAGEITWKTKYGGGNGDALFNQIFPTADSCYIVVGQYWDISGATSMDALVLKINETGNTVWSTAIDFGDYEHGMKAVPTYDGGIAVIGYAGIDYYHADEVIVFKIDSIGEYQWGRRIPVGLVRSQGCSIIQTCDSSLMLSGTLENSANVTLPFLIKMNAEGSLIWSKSYSLSGSPYLYNTSVLETSDGFLNLLCSYDMGLMKTDTSGNVVWTVSYMAVSYGGMYNDPSPDLIRDFNGTYSFTCNNGSGGNLVHVDSLGTVIHQHGLQLNSVSMLQCADTGYVLIGYGPCVGAKAYFYSDHLGLIKTNTNEYAECILYNGTSFTIPSSASASTLSCLSSPGGSAQVILLADTIPTLSSIPSCVDFFGEISEIEQKDFPFQAVPNPSNGTFKLLWTGSDRVGVVTWELFDVMGSAILSGDTDNGSVTEMDLRFLPNGIYFVKANCGDQVYTINVVIKK